MRAMPIQILYDKGLSDQNCVDETDFVKFLDNYVVIILYK
jgi:hypothetical protein